MEVDAFKEVFKRYKKKDVPLDDGTILDLSQDAWSHRVTIVPPITSSVDTYPSLKCPSEWKIYKLIPSENGAGDGIIYIRNPFTDEAQLNWGLRCLKEYSRSPPFRNNLEPFISEIIQDIAITVSAPLTENEEANFDWWNTVQSGRHKSFIDKIRWSTLGYHHDWDTKVYSDSKVSNFPEELSELSKFVLKCVPGYEDLDYRPEAAIVNYYPMDSSIGGHTDHSEPNQVAPLVSISFGQSAIFLIGGSSKSVEPIPMFLHSGDVLIMTRGSRKSFHAVPKIVHVDKIKSGENLLRFQNGESDFKFVKDYLSNHRINVNVRQVH